MTSPKVPIIAVSPFFNEMCEALGSVATTAQNCAMALTFL